MTPGFSYNLNVQVQPLFRVVEYVELFINNTQTGDLHTHFCALAPEVVIQVLYKTSCETGLHVACNFSSQRSANPYWKWWAFQKSSHNDEATKLCFVGCFQKTRSLWKIAKLIGCLFNTAAGHLYGSLWVYRIFSIDDTPHSQVIRFLFLVKYDDIATGNHLLIHMHFGSPKTCQHSEFWLSEITTSTSQPWEWSDGWLPRRCQKDQSIAEGFCSHSGGTWCWGSFQRLGTKHHENAHLSCAWNISLGLFEFSGAQFFGVAKSLRNTGTLWEHVCTPTLG